MIIHDLTTCEKVEAAKSETKSQQARRLVDYLYETGPAIMHEIARDCATGNVSAAAIYIQPALQRSGLSIVANLPAPLIENRFGEPSQSHEWRLVRHH